MKRQGIAAGMAAIAMGLVVAFATVAPITAFAADDTIVYITNTGTKYHTKNCKQISGKTNWAVTTAQARAQGLSACRTCSPDTYYEPTVTTQTSTAPVATTTPAAKAVTATPAATSITPAEAVQQAYALYVQNGLDANAAFARVQAITAQLATQPGNYAQIVQNDLASLSGTVTVATGLTATEAVQQAFALYVQKGLDTNTAFARVQAITAQLAAQPDNYAQFVQADLAALGK